MLSINAGFPNANIGYNGESTEQLLLDDILGIEFVAGSKHLRC